ncbi:MAG: DUF302 domain-containing protein [Chitinophagaceae bacterium]
MKVNRRDFAKQLAVACIWPLLPLQNTIMQPVNGVITLASPFGVKETIDRLQVFLLEQGATVYARIDQQKEVEKTGQQLHPLEFLLFGNPKAGGPLMQRNMLIALDLPLKIIAWEDLSGKTFVAFNDPGYMEKKYALTKQTAAPFDIGTLILKSLNLQSPKQ